MAIVPKKIADDLASSVFGVGPKVATGEMSQEELDAHGREEWPLHYAIADALGGVVKPFDQYQGPYIDLPEEGRLFIYSNDGVVGAVWNEDTKQESEPFMLEVGSENAAVDAALSVCENPDMHITHGAASPDPAQTAPATPSDPNELNFSNEDKKFLGDIGIRSHLLNSPMESKNARLLRKTASGTLLVRDDHPSANAKLQQIMGDPLDQPYTPFVQFRPNPGTMQIPNPLSPIEGDEAFFTYLIPGAVFQSHDGQQWVIDNYNQGAYGVEIYNRWYPRQRAFVNIDDIRRSIHSYVEPVQVVIPAPPPGVSYIGQPVRIVDGKSHL